MAEPSNRGIHFPEQQHQGHQHQQKSDQGGTLGGVKDKAQDIASSVASSAQQAWDTTRQQAQQYASQVGDFVQDNLGDVTGFIRRYPVACVLGGFVLGMMISGAFSGAAMLGNNYSRYR